MSKQHVEGNDTHTLRLLAKIFLAWTTHGQNYDTNKNKIVEEKKGGGKFLKHYTDTASCSSRYRSDNASLTLASALPSAWPLASLALRSAAALAPSSMLASLPSSAALVGSPSFVVISTDRLLCRTPIASVLKQKTTTLLSILQLSHGQRGFKFYSHSK